MIQMSSFMGASLIAMWIVVMAVNLFGNARVALISLVVGTIGYPFVVTIVMAGLKYQSLT
jgi:hypothetical protein